MLSPGMSLAVRTTTFDQSKSGSSSMPSSRACGSVDRIVAPYQAPGKTRSSVYLAAPVSLAGPSRRSGSGARARADLAGRRASAASSGVRASAGQLWPSSACVHSSGCRPCPRWYLRDCRRPRDSERATVAALALDDAGVTGRGVADGTTGEPSSAISACSCTSAARSSPSARRSRSRSSAPWAARSRCTSTSRCASTERIERGALRAPALAHLPGHHAASRLIWNAGSSNVLDRLAAARRIVLYVIALVIAFAEPAAGTRKLIEATRTPPPRASGQRRAIRAAAAHRRASLERGPDRGGMVQTVVLTS